MHLRFDKRERKRGREKEVPVVVVDRKMRGKTKVREGKRAGI